MPRGFKVVPKRNMAEGGIHLDLLEGDTVDTVAERLMAELRRLGIRPDRTAGRDRAKAILEANQAAREDSSS
ncbi:hypothetical protein [Sinomonas halotolerans]|uniref:Uncharacterized protein n=1 Tax=Sinomonas halotolerans TaxID=1644133 RepID=A0ABU9WZ20_9MICC